MSRKIELQIRTKTIEIAGDEPVTGQELFAEFVERLKDHPEIPFPIAMSHENCFELIDGWDFGSSRSKKLLKESSWEIIGVDGRVKEKWLWVVLNGDVEADDRFWHNGFIGYEAFRQPLEYIPNTGNGSRGFVGQVIQILPHKQEISIFGLRRDNSAFAICNTRELGFTGEGSLRAAGRVIFPMWFDRLGEE